MQLSLFLTLSLLGFAIGVPLSVPADNRIDARAPSPEECLPGYVPVSVDDNIACQALEGPTSPQCPEGQTAVNVDNKSVCAAIQQ